jgi:hypothetical protein
MRTAPVKQQAFKTLKAAIKHANGGAIVQVGSLFIVGIKPLTEIGLLAPWKQYSVVYAGNVTAGHLNRLGNANHCLAAAPIPHDAFPSTEVAA